jgi:hypothetical protein
MRNPLEKHDFSFIIYVMMGSLGSWGGKAQYTSRICGEES